MICDKIPEALPVHLPGFEGYPEALEAAQRWQTRPPTKHNPILLIILCPRWAEFQARPWLVIPLHRARLYTCRATPWAMVHPGGRTELLEEA